MSHKKPGEIIESGGFLKELVLRIKLIWKLFTDKRVSFWLKLLPIFSTIYLVNPIDLPTPLDDAAVVGLGFYLFVELCPQDIVSEHLAALRKVVSATAFDVPDDDDDVIDAEFNEDISAHGASEVEDENGQ